ncbi:hypothetical protein ACFE04_027687 [Oxalis oulophora]
MGTLIGHVAPGLAFFTLGIWHLINHIRLHSLNPNSYTSSPWFPSHKSKYIELYLIMLATSISISMELFIGPKRHQPFDSDGTIPSNHLHNFEHATISLTFFIYALFAILFDKLKPKSQYEVTQFIGAIAFTQQYLVFHLHSADHMGVEGQYHFLLQFVILVSLVTTIFGIWYPKNFMVSFIRSSSIILEGSWFVVMGYMLWTPGLIAKGCFLNLEEGHLVVRCHSDEALHRAKSLVNLQFSWLLLGTTVFVVALYLAFVIVKAYFGEDNIEYSSLILSKELAEPEDDDVESSLKNNESKFEGTRSFIHDMGKSISTIEMER